MPIHKQEGERAFAQTPEPEALPAGGSAAGERPSGAQKAAHSDVDEQKLQELVTKLQEAVPEGMQDTAPEALAAILRESAKLEVTDEDQLAYMLATAQHESQLGESMEEAHNGFKQGKKGWSAANHVNGRRVTASTREELESKYWDSAYGGKLGNERGTDDAMEYRGRGYVQLTGKDNYEKMSEALTDKGFTYTFDGVTYGTPEHPIDLVAHPDHVNQVPELAAALLVLGSVEGLYTGKELGDYINEDKTDFVGARSVINGDRKKNGKKIGEIAVHYQRILKQEGWREVVDGASREGQA